MLCRIWSANEGSFCGAWVQGSSGSDSEAAVDCSETEAAEACLVHVFLKKRSNDPFECVDIAQLGIQALELLRLRPQRFSSLSAELPLAASTSAARIFFHISIPLSWTKLTVR